MASPCIITFKGKKYSYEEFASKLHDGLLDDLIGDKTIDESRFTTGEPKLDIDAEIKAAESDYNSKQAKYEKANSELQKNAGQNQVDIFGRKPSDEMLFENNLKEQEKLVRELKKDAVSSKNTLDSLRVKKESMQPENQLRVDVEATNAEKAKILADKIRKGKIDGALSSVPGLAQAWNGAVEVMAQIVEQGGKVADAIEKAVAHLKESDYYKSKTSRGKEMLEKDFRDFAELQIPKEVEGKTLKLADRILKSDVISNEIKAGLKEKGGGYIPVNLELTQSDAKAYVDAFDGSGNLSEAIANVKDMSNGMSGLNRAAIGKELFENISNKARNAETLAEQKKWNNKAVDIAIFTADNFRKAGQEINAAKAWKRMIEKTPDGAVSEIKRKYAENNDPILKKHSEDIKGAKEIIDEFIKSEDFEKLVGEKVAAEMEKLGKKQPKKENIFNSKSVRDSRKEELKKKWAESKKTASASLVGLNKEQIEVVGEMALIHIIDGAVTFKKWAAKMKKDFTELSEDQLSDVWSRMKLSKDLDDKQRTVSDFAKYGVFDSMPAEQKSKMLDKWNKRLSKLDPVKRKKLLGDALEEIDKLGGLSDERFREMYAKELGLDVLDGEGEAKVRELVDRINKSDKSAQELQDLLDNNASKEEINSKKKEWENDVYEGQKANGELSSFFKQDKRIGTTLSTILQGNLLGTLSVLKNIYSNTLIQPLRFAARGIGSTADFVMSKAATLPGLNKLLSQDRTYDALSYWRGEMKGVLPGLKTSFGELVKGINPEEMTERDFTQQLEPLKSAVRFFDGLTGKEKQTAYEQINNFTEAAFGFPAEVMFRLLNLGDKPFRKSAEYGAAYELGKLKGLKGNDLEKFILFPDPKSAELIKQRAEKSVYQQSEGGTKVIQEALKKVETSISNTPYIGDVGKIIFKTQLPYVKTPLNILGETLEFALPEYSLGKAIYKAINGDRRAAVESFGKAVVGFAIREAMKQLSANNLVTPSANRQDKEGTAIQYMNVPPNSLNITGLQRMYSGGDPKPKDGDVWINYNNMGVVGILMSLHANQNPMDKDASGYLSDLATSASYMAQASFEQSFLQGTNSFLDAIKGDDNAKKKWAINTLGSLGSIVWPNTLANISKAEDNTVRETRSEMFGDELSNTFKTKFFMGDQLPSKVNLWGEPVKSAPEGRNKYAWFLLDVTKAKPVDIESFNYKIFDLWKNIDDPKEKRAVLPNIPQNYFTVKKERITLTQKQYEEYQTIVGKNRAQMVQMYVKSPSWSRDTNEMKVKRLKKIYEEGAKNAKRQMQMNNPDLR